MTQFEDKVRGRVDDRSMGSYREGEMSLTCGNTNRIVLVNFYHLGNTRIIPWNRP